MLRHSVAPFDICVINNRGGTGQTAPLKPVTATRRRTERRSRRARSEAVPDFAQYLYRPLLVIRISPGQTPLHVIDESEIFSIIGGQFADLERSLARWNTRRIEIVAGPPGRAGKRRFGKLYHLEGGEARAIRCVVDQVFLLLL